MALLKRIGVLLVTVLLASLVALPAAPAYAQGTSLTVTPSSAPQNSVVVFTFAGFQAKESVNLWLTLPDYSVVGLGNVIVGSSGGGDLPVFISSAFPTGRHYFSARGNKSGLTAVTPFDLTIGAGAGNSPGITLTVDEDTKSQGNCFLIEGSGYASNETLASWLRLPNDVVIGFGEFQASSSGTFADIVCAGSLGFEGTHYYTAYGKSSGSTGIATFTLTRGDYIGAPAGGATLEAQPSSAKQLDVITLVGTGFLPGETISLWLTLPDGRVLSMFEGVTATGNFAVDVFLPPLPVGRHYFSAYGQTSGLRAIAPFDLEPGTGG